MSSTRIDMDGREKLKKFLIQLPKRTDRFISKTNLKFMEDVRDLAKQLAPRDTGSLREDIRLGPVRRGKNIKVWKIIIDNPAAAPQEFGFNPHFANIINSAKMVPGIYFVKKNTPFMRPALEFNLSSYSQKLEKAAKKAIKGGIKK